MDATLKRKQEDEEPARSSSAKKSKVEENLADATKTLENFKTLLDFSQLGSKQAISERFDKVAAFVLHDLYLVVKNGDKKTRFEILELEFYLQKEICHEDPFTHGSEEQKISGRWYFHRAPRRSADATRSLTSLTSYRGGTRKGLDLTIGRLPSSPKQKTSEDGDKAGAATEGTSNNAVEDTSLLRGGALLRTIRRVHDKKIISGPSLLVDQILELSKVSGIPELVEQKWSGNTSAFDSSPDVTLFLEVRPPPGPGLFSTSKIKPPTIYRSPRIGLDLSHPGTEATSTHPRVVFLSRPYRYFVHPDLLTANGRPQTFLGILHFCIDAGHSLGNTKLRAELARITGIKDTTVAKYLGDYKAGLEDGSLAKFVGPKGKGTCSSPGPYLMMMGTLDGLSSDDTQ